MSRPFWWLIATAGSSPPRPPRPSRRCGICCSWSSYLPEVGQSLSSFAAEEPAPFLNIDPDEGTFTVRPDAVAETFLQDCDAVIQREAINKTARQSLAVLGEPVRSAAWQDIASTYLICVMDRGTPAHRQREFAGRAGNVVELDAGHHPFLSQPGAVCELIPALC